MFVSSKRGFQMKKIKQIHAASGHSIAIFAVDGTDGHPGGGKFTNLYVAKNFDADGVTFFYLGRGHIDAPNQICVWYKNKKMWSSFGNNFQEAIDGAQRDGWLAAD